MSDKSVLRWYNDSDVVRDQLDRRLAVEGIGYVDYGTGRSLDSGDSDRPTAAGQAFNALETISAYGGKGAVRAGDDNLITVGRWEPNCLSLYTTSEGRTLKCARMDHYVVIDPADEMYQQVDGLFNDGNLTLRHSVDPSPIEDTLKMLKKEGRLRTPA